MSRKTLVAGCVKTPGVGSISFEGREEDTGFNKLADKLVQQDDLIRRQREALKQIFNYASAIGEIGATPSKAFRIEANTTIKAIINTAQMAL